MCGVNCILDCVKRIYPPGKPVVEAGFAVADILPDASNRIGQRESLPLADTRGDPICLNPHILLINYYQKFSACTIQNYQSRSQSI